MATHTTPQGRRVRVDGREDIGVVIDEGRNLGMVYCNGIWFPTGEVAYYEADRVHPADG